MSETALYYTLSTVSQTLAGALGMLAAFLALRVSALDAAIRSELAWLEGRTGTVNADVRPQSGSLQKTLEGWKARLNEHQFQAGSWEVQTFRRAEHSLGVRTALLQQAKNGFTVSALVMGGCFIGLAAAPWLSCARPRAWVATAVAIAGGIGCLVWYGKIVREALD